MKKRKEMKITKAGEWKGGVWYPADVPKDQYPTWREYMAERRKKKEIANLFKERRKLQNEAKSNAQRLSEKMKEYFELEDE